MAKKVAYASLFLIGLGTGVINGLIGIGGGALLVPAMIHYLHVPRHQAHGTSLAVILPTALASTLFYGLRGRLDLGLVLPLVLAGMAGAYLGARLMGRLKANHLRLVFALFMLAVGMRMVLVR